MSASDHSKPPSTAPGKPPAPSSVPKLPQTIFNLEKKGGTPGGILRRLGHK
jgi:hypothetical protein